VDVVDQRVWLIQLYLGFFFFFTSSVVFTQCKTRWLSIRQQGMVNPVMNFGLLFETSLGCFLCYIPGLGDVLGTRPIRFQHWFPGMPFCLFIFFYDEIRKYLMRSTSTKVRDKDTKKMNNNPGWLERMTYY
jgi:sodium/potassium-transporting ATPase subunit alpha